MITTAHLLTGAAIGYASGDVFLGSAIAFASHYALDAVPHASWKPVKNFREHGWKGTDKRDLVIKSLEPLFGVAAIGLFLSMIPTGLWAPVIVAAFFGWAPDLLVFLEWKFGINRWKPIRNFELKYHKHDNTIHGIAPQLFVIGGAFLLLTPYPTDLSVYGVGIFGIGLLHPLANHVGSRIAVKHAKYYPLLVSTVIRVKEKVRRNLQETGNR